MKVIFSALFLLSALGANAAVRVFTCESRDGKITIKDIGSTVEIDFTEHEFYHQALVYKIFSGIVKAPEVNYKDYVLKISPELYVKGEKSKFENGDKKLLIRALAGGITESCEAEVKLSKKHAQLSILHKCSTLGLENSRYEDDLTCR